ncbi:MAG: hypothetical protein JW720_01775 [Sedimentisphaerales bacterium]|nr:hypothetical protein [Sedimentisphaerales bacterium]
MTSRIRKLAQTHPLATVLLVSGFLGFCLGLCSATWQVTVESGQVLAGIVKYPPGNPFYIYHIKVMTILNQISAVLLYMGLSERTLSILVSGLLGMLSFQGLATLVFAINRNRTIALLSVILIYFANYIGDGAIYPIWLLGEPQTYGIAGLSFVVLVIALLGAKAYRSGFFLLGAAPCVHPSLGTWLVIIVLVSAFLERDWAAGIIKRHYGWLIAGVLVSVGSFGYQFHLIESISNSGSGTGRIYFDAYINHWSSHHQKLYWGYPPGDPGYERWGVVFCIYSVIVSYLSRSLLAKDRPVCFMFTVVMVCGIGALLLGFLTQFPPDRIPLSLLMLMPGRYLNINNMTIAACVIGVLTFKAHKPYVCNYNSLFVLLMASFFSRHCEVLLAVLSLIVWWLGYMVVRRRYPSTKAIMLNTADHNISYELMISLVVAAFLVVNIPQKEFFQRYLRSKGDMKDHTNNEFYSAAARGQGLLLTTHYGAQISLKTRRSVLVDMSSPNTIIYAPGGGSALSEVLKKIYGVDLLEPPAQQYRHKEIPAELYRRIWQERSSEQWREIGREFGVGDVLTPEDWQLALPIGARGEGMILYEIPDD